jgi:hypothetical protein
MAFPVIQRRSRAVESAGVAVTANREWMKQVARGLVDLADCFLRGATHLIHDRDPRLTLIALR